MGNELIKITYNDENGTATVSGRDLHDKLKIENPYHKWFPRMCEYGFIEDKDYITLVGQKCPTNNPKNPYTIATDHQLNIDMAKEICMIQRSEYGKIYRQYFLEIEKKWNDPEMVMARALTMANKKITALQTQIDEQKPLVDFAGQIQASDDSIGMASMAKIASKNGIKIGRNNLFKFLRDKKVLDCWNEPYQSYMNLDWFEVIESTYKYRGKPKITKTTLVKPKGQIGIVKMLMKNYNGEE